MGWNDHMEGIDPGDPDPVETLRAQADELRDREKYETPQELEVEYDDFYAESERLRQWEDSHGGGGYEADHEVEGDKGGEE